MDLGEMYNYLLVELSEPHSRDWLFVSSPYPLILITLGYIYFVFYAGPRYMKDRPPYKLRTFILIYNVIQILANAWFVKEHISAGWLSEIKMICKHNSLKLNETKLFDVEWWLMFLKLFDYVETVVFVLRKKQNQVSGLHVYHHVSNIVCVWYYLKYYLDARLTFLALCNCFVHVIMYIYYFIAAWSPDLQQMIAPMKSFITKLQMVQFVIMIFNVAQFLNPNCEMLKNRGIIFIFIGHLFAFLYLFYDFYKKNYTSKQKNN